MFYVPAELDIAKQLEQFGVLDGEEATAAGVEDLVEMSNALYEPYGRKVDLKPFHASGDGRSPSAARADAVRVAGDGGVRLDRRAHPDARPTSDELARHGVLCIAVRLRRRPTTSGPETPPTPGASRPRPTRSSTARSGSAPRRCSASPAQFAGDPEMRTRPRRFGIVHYEQDPPVFGPLKQEAIAYFAAQGRSVDTVIQYILDPNTLNAQAQAIIGRLKRDGVTSVVFLGDPLMPRLLTQQATRQDYHPEWMFTGTVFTDTSAVARLYDQSQMAHAFGASSNPARTSPSCPSRGACRSGGSAPSRRPPRPCCSGPVVQQLFLGIHMAGPHLSAETFAGGLFNYPPTGGTSVVGKDPIDLFLDQYLAGDTTPAISFGPGEDGGAVDYVAVDDFTISWWDPDAVGPDENGEEGRGLWQYTGMGLRLPLGEPEMPAGVTEGFLFERMLSGTGSPLFGTVEAFGLDDLQIADDILESTPPLDALPEYPRWPESPAAATAPG